MDAKVVWQHGMTLIGQASSPYTIKMDSAKESGGDDDGFRPTELLAIGTCGCTSMDVLSILRKKKVDFSAFEVKVHVESRTTEHPHVFTSMEFEYIVTGNHIHPEDVERAVQLSEEKYCQCIAMLSKTAAISHKITIHELAN
jgi:putative redox protein